MAELSKEDQDELLKYILLKLNEQIKTGAKPSPGAIDKYQDRLDIIMGIIAPQKLEEVRRTRWQVNRLTIESVIHEYITECNRLPTQNELHSKTGLSRPTISKHLKEGLNSPSMREELESYRIMTPKVLNALYKLGMCRNDTKAMKIFLDYFKEQGPTNIREQNNYIQVNNTRIDEVTIEGLPNDAKSEIESIIRRYLND